MIPEDKAREIIKAYTSYWPQEPQDTPAIKQIANMLTAYGREEFERGSSVYQQPAKLNAHERSYLAAMDKIDRLERECAVMREAIDSAIADYYTPPDDSESENAKGFHILLEALTEGAIIRGGECK